jgi:hypothetical protein
MQRSSATLLATVYRDSHGTKLSLITNLGLESWPILMEMKDVVMQPLSVYWAPKLGCISPWHDLQATTFCKGRWRISAIDRRQSLALDIWGKAEQRNLAVSFLCLYTLTDSNRLCFAIQTRWKYWFIENRSVTFPNPVRYSLKHMKGFIGSYSNHSSGNFIIITEAYI